VFSPGAGVVERDACLVAGAGDAVDLGRVGQREECVEAEPGGERGLAVSLRDPENGDLVDPTAVLVTAPELAQELDLEPFERERLPCPLASLVAQF
jgi:hypothetical protein